VDPVSASIVIQRPRAEVFAYLADIANHRGFLDHSLVDWHLTREDSIGLGAGARFRAKLRFNRFSYFDVTFTEVEAPYRIAFVGRGGKYDRTLVHGEITVKQEGSGAVRVEWTVETEPKLPSDHLMELVAGQTGVARRGLHKGLQRLRAILEEGAESSGRATIAGGARKPASGFRLDPRLAEPSDQTGPVRAHAGSRALD